MHKSMRAFSRDESGAVLIYVSLIFLVLLGFTSLAIDFGYRHYVFNRLQITADMAALAGASQLPNATNVKSKANAYAQLNMPVAFFQDVLATPDIVLGNWDNKVTPKFSTSRTPVNAVRVYTRRSGNNPANSNPHQTILARIVGGPVTVNLEAKAIAWATTDVCFSNGYIAEDEIEGGSKNNYIGFCQNGQEGIKVGSQNDIDCTSQFSLLSVSNFVEGSGNDNLHLPNCPPKGDGGYSKVVREDDLPPTDAQQIDTLLDDFKNQTGLNPLPDYLGSAPVPITGDYSGPYDAGDYYIIDGKATVQTNLSNVGIYATGNIEFDSNLLLQNVFLASEDQILMGSNNQLGALPYGADHTPPSPSACFAPMQPVFMAAKNFVKLGSNTSMHGVQVISGGSFEIGSENKIHGNVGVQAAGEIKYGSEEQYQGCNDDSHLLVAGPKTLVIVR